MSIPSGFSQQHNLPLGEEVIFPDPNGIDASSELMGELRQWHKVTLVIDGPKASQFGQTLLVVDDENASVNLDVRPNAALPVGLVLDKSDVHIVYFRTLDTCCSKL